MPHLSRKNAAPLLSMVNGKPYATQDAHHDALPTPPATNSTRSSASQHDLAKQDDEDDLNASPVSSEDEGDSGVAHEQQVSASSFSLPRQLGGAGVEPRVEPDFKMPSRVSPGSSGTKRSNDSDPSSSDSEIFPSQGSPRKRTKNIHAKPMTYSKQMQKSTNRKPSLKSPKKPMEPKPTPGPKFKTPKGPKGADMFEFGKTQPQPAFKDPSMRDEMHAQRFHSRSTSLSSLSPPPDSPDVEEIESLDLPAAQPYVSKTECSICGQAVDLSLKENFEDKFTKGKRMNYTWQQRFCKFHKQHEAKELWKQRHYPEIDWSGLERRMRRHHKHLKDVMSGAKPSLYREQLAEKVKARSKTAVQTMNDEEGKRGASVGYYGPRGQKMMTDHIITHLSDSLRIQAAKDKLVAASGVSGGVSGFIQAVLVPELAEQLVREDMSVSDERTRQIVAESAELGELLNPEMDDKVTEVVEVDDG